MESSQAEVVSTSPKLETGRKRDEYWLQQKDHLGVVYWT